MVRLASYVRRCYFAGAGDGASVVVVAVAVRTIYVFKEAFHLNKGQHISIRA